MLNLAILFLTVFVLLTTLKHLIKILKAGNLETLLKHKEVEIVKLKEDLDDPETEKSFAIALVIVSVIKLTMLVASIYILTQILKFA